eukprot:9165719-Lingulodinium_polyedra.AAC.1
MECVRCAICEPLWRQSADAAASLRAVSKTCTMMRSNGPRAAAPVRQSHARAFHAHSSICCARGVRKRAICGGGRSVGVVA